MGVPFLVSVDDIVLAVLGLGRGGGDIGNVGSGIWLCNGDAAPRAPGQEIRQEFLLQLLAAVLDDRGDTEGEARVERTAGAAETRASKLDGQKPAQ